MTSRIRWAPRIEQSLIKRLYEADASGVPDLSLCDEAGVGLYLRCQAIIRVHRRQVECPDCGTVFELSRPEQNATVPCPGAGCAWQTSRTEYAASWSKKRIWCGKALEAFEEYHDQYPRARTYREKILLIDRLIHRFHWDLKAGMPNRSAANNLLEGSHDQVVAFLDRLSGIDPSVTSAWHETARKMMERRKTAR